MKSYLNKEEFDSLLGRKPLTYVVDEMNNMGISIKYNNFYSLYNNKSSWSLIYAYGVAKIFDKKIEDLFIFK